MSIGIVTDSNCDLPEQLIQEFGIIVVPLYINIGTDSYLDGVDMSRQEFYEGLSGFASHPTTSVPGPGMFVEAYERLAAEGATEILSIHISTTLSAVANSARLAAEETGAARVTVFDSGNLTLGTGLLVLAAAQAAQAGRSLDEIIALMEEQVSRTYCFAALDTLEFLRRSGRLSRFQSRLGSMLQVKPLLTMHDGEMEMERVRTRKRAIARVIELVSDLGPLQELTLVHTHAPERAGELHEQARHLFPEGKPPLSEEVTPVIGAHIGPGAVGFVAIKKRDE
jgi:DegV family protein with EDD domain